MRIIPMTIAEANEFVKQYHRHHKPPQGYKFCIGVAEGGKVVGVAIVGRPIARNNDDGFTLEVTRTCTDGTKNANSMLYGACWRATRALGYHRLITYTVPSESGASLRGAGFRIVGETRDGARWSRESRPRVDTHPLVKKLRWEKSDRVMAEGA